MRASRSNTEYFEIKSSKALKLQEFATRVKPRYDSEVEYQTRLGENHLAISDYQEKLYAGHARAMLIVFQGMDTSGKDGAIKHVMSGVNPQGCSVASFKAPTSNELDHDFLWRVNRVLPARGQIGIFNRSYYEEVLVPRVHPDVLAVEKLPPGHRHGSKFWKDRYGDIVRYEKYLHRQGYDIVKIFIHISKDEQKVRLLDRFNNPQKLWKISESDIRERSYWRQYQEAYGECLRHTSSKHAPWYIVPGNDKKQARLSISQILVNRFKQLDLAFPELSAEQKKKLRKLKVLLRKG